MGRVQERGVLYSVSLERARSRGGVMSEDPFGVWNSGSSLTSPKMADSSPVVGIWFWFCDEMPPCSSRPFMLMLGEVGSSLKSG